MSIFLFRQIYRLSTLGTFFLQKHALKMATLYLRWSNFQTVFRQIFLRSIPFRDFHPRPPQIFPFFFLHFFNAQSPLFHKFSHLLTPNRRFDAGPDFEENPTTLKQSRWLSSYKVTQKLFRRLFGVFPSEMSESISRNLTSQIRIYWNHSRNLPVPTYILCRSKMNSRRKGFFFYFSTVTGFKIRIKLAEL